VKSSPLRRKTALRNGSTLKRVTPLDSRSTLAPESPTRRGERAARAAVIAATHARSGYRCEARLLVPEVECAGRLDCDEVMGRGRRPGGHLDVTNTQSLCRAHHDWKDAYPIRARELGLSKSYGDE
jgi:hypothetical protein